MSNDGGDLRRLREVQAAWPECYPYAHKATLKAAGRLNLSIAPQALARLVTQRQFPTLVAVMVRAQLAGDFDRIRQMG